MYPTALNYSCHRCNAPIVLSQDTSKTLGFECLPDFECVEDCCGWCGAYNMLPPCELVPEAHLLGCRHLQLSAGIYPSLAQVQAYEQATGRDLIAADWPISTVDEFDIAELTRELEEHPEQLWEFGPDGPPLASSDEARVAYFANWLSGISADRLLSELLSS